MSNDILNPEVLGFLRGLLVILLIVTAAVLATPPNKIPLALRGLAKILGRDAASHGPVQGRGLQSPNPKGKVPLWKKLLAFILTLLAFAIAQCAFGVTILPIGDSITEGTLARPNLYSGRPNYRVQLAAMLESGGKKDVEFLGPRTTCNWNEKGEIVKDAWQHHQGISGYRIYTGNNRRGYLDTLDDDLKNVPAADVILFMIGTNDILAGMNADEMFVGWETLVKRLLKKYPAAKIYVGTILDMDTPAHNAVVAAYNAKIRNFRHPLVKVVDINAACPRKTAAQQAENFADWLHPTWAGHRKIATAWFKAIK